MSLGLLSAVLSVVAVEGVRNRRIRGNVTATQQPVTFEQWYQNHNEGRGIWKWNNALAAYQRHFAGMVGQPVSVAEVGVQSGGSISMWKAALGTQIHFYGLDINPGCKKFEDATTSITIGDQADPQMWNSFYTNVVGTLDILVDDGGHESHQMLVTLQQSFPRLNPGGFVAIEDIHGRHYVQSFFHPAAQAISAWHIAGQVASVAVYPYLMVLQKIGGTRPALDLPVSKTVDSFPAFYTLLDSSPGQNIAIENPAWGSFLSAVTLSNIFTELAPLHDYSMTDSPPGCATSAGSATSSCVNTITNSNYQAKVTGVHIFASKLILEIAAKPVVINAVRKGTEWLPYGF